MLLWASAASTNTASAASTNTTSAASTNTTSATSAPAPAPAPRLSGGGERGPKGKRPAASRVVPPDPEFFARVGGRWRVQLGALVGGPASPAALRDHLAGDDLQTFGADTALAAIPDDLLVTAAATGAVTSAAFLDILDGDCFVRAPCLCCYAAHSAARAREASVALRMYRRYYDGDSFVRSRAYARVVAAMSRDLWPEEAAEVKDHAARLSTTPDAIREINGTALGDSLAGGLCVVLPPCRPGVLWVYSTLEGRRLLRHLARKGGAPVKVTVASSDPTAAPRFRYRMYAISFVAGPAGAPPLLDTALAWVRARGGG